VRRRWKARERREYEGVEEGDRGIKESLRRGRKERERGGGGKVTE
jgi:hypothetical protein